MSHFRTTLFSAGAIIVLAGSLQLMSPSPDSSIVSIAQQKSLASNLRDWQNLSDQEQIARLREFRQSGSASGNERNEAAYVLARLLQKNISGNALNPDSDATDTDTSKSGGIASFDAGTSAQASPKEVIELFQESSKIEPLAVRAQNHIVDIATKYAMEDDLRSHLEILRVKKSEGAARNALDYAMAQSYFRSGDFDKAKALFSALKKEAASSQGAIGANYYLGQIDIAEHSATQNSQAVSDSPINTALTSSGVITDPALKYFRAYLKSCPDGKHALEITRRLLAASQAAGINNVSAPAVPASDRELFGRVFYTNGAWGEALKQFDTAPGTGSLEQRAICLLKTGHLAEAQETTIRAVRSGASYEKAANLIADPLTRAQTLDFWKAILDASPASAKVDDALWNIATRMTPPQGTPYFQRLLKQYPTCEYAPESVWWLLWQQVKNNLHDPGKLGSALVLAHTGIDKYPTTKAAARLGFWSGKINESLHKTVQAKLDYEFVIKNFPSYYYGHRAKARISYLNATESGAAKVDRSFSTRPDRRILEPNWSYPTAESIVPASEVSKKFGSTVALLYKLGQFDECLSELPADAGPEFKSALYAMKDDNAGAIRAAGRTLDGQPTRSERWQMTYPRMYGAFVATDAHLEHVDPYLVHALIREESRYNEKALSRVKAIGLMQLMPGTAAGAAKNVGVQLSNNSDIFKPEINIRLGTHYLASVLSRADGNAMLAIASYNGGPNAVHKWLSDHKAAGYSDFDVFVENIPFRETRDYVRKVFGSYWTYEEIYPSKG